MTQILNREVLDTGEILIAVDEVTSAATQEGILNRRVKYCRDKLDEWLDQYSLDNKKILPEERNEEVQLLQFNLGAITQSKDPEIQREFQGLAYTFHGVVEDAPAVWEDHLASALMLLQGYPANQTELIARSLGRESAEEWLTGGSVSEINDEQALADWITQRRTQEWRLPLPNPELDEEVRVIETSLSKKYGYNWRRVMALGAVAADTAEKPANDLINS